MFVYIIVAKIESGAYLHSKPTKEQLYNICEYTYLNIVIHQTMFFDPIHIESNK